MKQEIRQEGKVILWDNGGSTMMIFRNLVGLNIKDKTEYRNYIKHVALPNGFKVGTVELWRNGELIEHGKITL